MLAIAVATTTSRALSYGTIYTTKLLRRGTDIDRPKKGDALSELVVADAMHPFPTPLELTPTHEHTSEPQTAPAGERTEGVAAADWTVLLGPLTRVRRPQALFSNESLAQALRQLVLYGRDGLPVLSTDGRHLQGWITNQNVLRAVATQLSADVPNIEAGHRAAEWAATATEDPEHDPGAQLSGYHIAEYTLAEDSPAIGHTLGEFTWRPGHIPVSVLHHRRLYDSIAHIRLQPGDRVNLLVPNEPDETAGSHELDTSRDLPQTASPERDHSAVARQTR
jgi:CIC family chloride channel protein